MVSPCVRSYFWLVAGLFLVFSRLTAGKEPGNHNHLSNEEHLDGGNDHNQAYDHDAFLGQDSRSFDNLTPGESKKRLAVLVDKIDTDKDGKVSYEELKEWIHKSQKNYILEDVDRQWKTHKPEAGDEGTVTWEDYRRVTYGFMDDLEKDMSEEDIKTYKDMMRRDERRWNTADKNGDKVLNKKEFADFLHPEEAEHMRDVVVDETLEDVDKDKDGKISLNEYISDMYAPDATGDEVPDWVVREKEQFSTHRDKNQDGFMDRDEVRDWIIPQDYDQSGVEAKHLITESDKDKDGVLTKDEILNNYDLFVGSQATDFGEALTKHDEL